MFAELIAKLKFAECAAAEVNQNAVSLLCQESWKAIEYLRQRYLESECDAIELTGELADKPFWRDVNEVEPVKSDPNVVREWFLVALQSGVVTECCFEFDRNSCYGYGWHSSTGSPITHWMSLPKHPREKELHGNTLSIEEWFEEDE